MVKVYKSWLKNTNLVSYNKNLYISKILLRLKSENILDKFVLIEGYSFILLCVKSISVWGSFNITFLYPLGIFGVWIINFSIIFSKNKEENSLDIVM